MEQLVAQVSEKIGVPADKARVAVETVLKFVKDKLPDPIAAQIDGAIDSAGTGQSGDTLNDAAGKLGGMFGK